MRDFLLLQIELYKLGQSSIGIDTIRKLAEVYFTSEEIKELEDLQ